MDKCICWLGIATQGVLYCRSWPDATSSLAVPLVSMIENHGAPFDAHELGKQFGAALRGGHSLSSINVAMAADLLARGKNV